FNGSIFMNGEKASSTANFNSPLAYSTNTGFTIAADPNNTDPFTGNFLEILYYNKELTRTEHDQIVCHLGSKYSIATKEVVCN
ncbi:MAG: hypothetical protein SFU98_05005, partial [Leptospiraceae bacterium]|nr:hypothetical protein [Leptospiraceae bacterium]